MTHKCVSKLTTIGSDNGLSPGRRQAIIWTIAGILLIGPLGTNFSEILIGNNKGPVMQEAFLCHDNFMMCRTVPAPLLTTTGSFAFHFGPIWWRHQMETFSALLVICAGNSPVSGEFPAQRPVTQSFYVFFDLRLIKRLSKHSRGWWFETLSRPLWRYCNEKRHAYRGCKHTNPQNKPGNA